MEIEKIFEKVQVRGYKKYLKSLRSGEQVVLMCLNEDPPAVNRGRVETVGSRIFVKWGENHISFHRTGPLTGIQDSNSCTHYAKKHLGYRLYIVMPER